MAGVTRAHPKPNAATFGELDALASYASKDITILAVDFDVDIDDSTVAYISLMNTIQRYGNILVKGSIHSSDRHVDVIMEGDLSGSDYDSADGTVTGTVGAALVEDIINMGTIDSIDFASGTVAVTIRTNLITA
jgi:hypothetical protein